MKMALNNVKKSVCFEDLERYIKWNKNFGSFNFNS